MRSPRSRQSHDDSQRTNEIIYRIIGETLQHRWDEDETELIRIPGTLKGAFQADLSWSGWDDLPAPAISDPRVRFWFTEAGWRRYGRRIMADAMRSGRTCRLLRRKNPPDSAVAYRDKWQVALLPVKCHLFFHKGFSRRHCRPLLELNRGR